MKNDCEQNPHLNLQPYPSSIPTLQVFHVQLTKNHEKLLPVLTTSIMSANEGADQLAPGAIQNHCSTLTPTSSYKRVRPGSCLQIFDSATEAAYFNVSLMRFGRSDWSDQLSNNCNAEINRTEQFGMRSHPDSFLIRFSQKRVRI